MRPTLCALALLSCLILLASQSCEAQAQYVGIPTVNFAPAAQQQDEWCWAASIQMILNYYQIPVSQQMIVARVKGALIDQAGSDGDISASLNGWAPDIHGNVRVVRSLAVAGAPSPQILIAQLAQSHPMLLTFATGAYSGHAVVITGASYVPSASGPLVLSMIIRDPWPSPTNVQTSGRVEIAGPQLIGFLQLVRSYWIVSVGYGPSSSSAHETSGQADPDHADGDDKSDECAALSDYASAARHKFRSLRGEVTDNDSDSTTYRAKHGIPGFSDCEIDVYRGSDLQPSATCLADDAEINEQWRAIKACFSDSQTTHRSLSSGEEFKLTTGGVTIRLRSSSTHTRLWVDAPDE